MVKWLSELKVGDKVTRMLAGIIPHELIITEIKDGLIYCGDWTFDLETGIEVDDDIGFGPKYGFTGSILVEGIHNGQG